MTALTSTVPEGRSFRQLFGAYVALTKPRIIELLLVTTAAGDDPGAGTACRRGG